MSQNWKTYKLKELSSKIGSGATPRGGNEAYKTEGISLIRSQNILDFIFSTNGLAFIDDDQAAKLNNVEVQSRDVLLNITGDSVARVCQVPDELLPARVNQHVAIIRANQKLLNPDFLKYTLLSPNKKEYLLILASAGATRNAITKSMIEDFAISIPPLPQQTAIATILSALDDKIELNLQQNKTLEEMAMTLYKHWFVDFGPVKDGKFIDSELGRIPEGWEVSTIGELYDTTSGGTPSRKRNDFYEGGNIPWVKSKELHGDYIIETEEKITELGLKNSSAKLIPKGSILLAMYGATVGETSILSFDATCNQAICGILQKQISNIYVYLFLTINKEEVLNQAVGSAQQNISQVIIKNIKILKPQNDLKCFSDLELYFNQIEQNRIENKELISLRDSLLPKLISGEILVKDLKNNLKEVL
jgi:type I restriction enzyme S subunit